MEFTQYEQQREKQTDINEQSLREYRTVKKIQHFYHQSLRRKEWAGRGFEDLMAENFPNLAKGTKNRSMKLRKPQTG